MKLFAHPFFLLCFVPAALYLLLVLWSGKKLKEHLIHALFSSQAYAQITSGLRSVSPWRNSLLFATVFFLLAALAQPQWGTEILTVQGSFAQTIIAVDVSASMQARDLQPDRLDNAKTMLRMLIKNLKEERIGLLAFTSQAYVQCPITTDEEALLHFVSALQPDMLPVPGTSLAAPVQLAARLLSKYPGKKALILLTDGEDHEPEELKAAKTTALQNGIRVIAIGIGTKEGTLLPGKVDAQGRIVEYKKDKKGNTVVSKLDEKSLLDLAQTTGGVYIPYTTPARVASQVEEAVRELDRSLSNTSKHVHYKNRYQWALVLALLCLSGYLCWPRGRKRTRKSSPNND